jgi:putative phage-type endonuclease
MKVVELEQNSPKWLSWRRNKIRGSDAPSIQNIGFMTPNQLYLNKLGLWEPKINSKMTRGHELEDSARKLAMDMLGTELHPLCVEHDKRSWQAASLDGIDPKQSFIVEIKTGGAAALERAKAGIVPDYHQCQIQHQLEVSELDKCVYFFFDGINGYPIDIYRDTKYINQLNEAEQKFWDNLQDFVPPPLTGKDYEAHESEERIRLAREWLEVNERLTRDEKLEKQLREMLINEAGDRNTVGGGVKILMSGRAGSVDYKAIPEIKGVNLDKFRKEPVKFFRVTKG